MFQNKQELSDTTPDSLFETNIDKEITSIIESISYDRISMFELLVESNNVSLLNETSVVDGFITIIKKLIDHIKSLYDKFASIIFSIIKPAHSYIQKYKEKLNNLKDEDISHIVYEYKKFDIKKNIPVVEYIRDVEKYIEILNNEEITSKMVAEFKSTIDQRISIIRGKMLGMNNPIDEEDFISSVKKIFRNHDEIFTKHLTKKDLNTFIKEIEEYDSIKKDVENLRNSIIELYHQYEKKISKIYSIDYSSDGNSVVIKTSSGKEFHIDLVKANMYKEYQSLVSHFIVEVSTSYMTVFKEKLEAIKEKFEMEYAIIKQVVYHIS